MSKAVTQATLQALIATVLLAALACHKEKQYTWKDILPTSGCDPRTPEARAKLGTCPKVADPQHPTQQEVQEFVAYMNKKDPIEGTMTLGDLAQPGCWSGEQIQAWTGPL
jgi:hypothetical protein